MSGGEWDWVSSKRLRVGPKRSIHRTKFNKKREKGEKKESDDVVGDK